MRALFGFMNILAVPLMILNMLCGVVAGIWLSVLGEWSAIGYGIAALVVSSPALAIVFAPGMLLADIAVYFGEKNIKAGFYFFTFWGSLYGTAVITAWCVAVLYFFTTNADSSSMIPILIWSYGVAIGPLVWMAQKEQLYGDGFASIVATFFSQIGYIVMIIMALFFRASFVDVIISFGAVMVAGQLLQYIAILQIERESGESGSFSLKGQSKETETNSDTLVSKNISSTENKNNSEIFKKAKNIIKNEESKDFNGDENPSYFIKHWQGKLSLGVSYWINYVLLSIIFTTLVAITYEILNFDFTNNPIFPSVFIVFIWLFVLVFLTPWILIGLWRSAENHIKRNNRFFWARVVQILVVIGWAQSIAQFINIGIPQIIELSKIALNKDGIPEYKIRILNNGDELEISGGIKFGLTKEVKKYFLKYPDIKVIHLNSSGGRIAEAIKLSNFLESKDITTYSSRGCYSTCVDIFMSGKYRFIHKNAKLGFHQPFFPGASSSDLNKEIEKSKYFYISKGIKNDFVEKAFSIPHDDLWKPSHFELKQAGVIHKVVDSFASAATEACDGGDALECYVLGKMYEEGKGVKKSYSKAKEFYGKACDVGDAFGCEAYARLNKR